MTYFTIVKKGANKPSADATQDAAQEAWFLLFNLVHGERGNFQERCTKNEMSPAQAQLLLLLAPERQLAMSDLAQSLACDASNITGLVDKLEERGVLERKPAPHDRRVKLIALTAKGLEARAGLVDFFSEPPAGFEVLSAAEKKTLRDLLRRVSRAEA